MSPRPLHGWMRARWCEHFAAAAAAVVVVVVVVVGIDGCIVFFMFALLT